MTKVAILSANLGDFDKPVEPVKQDGHGYIYHCWTDEHFPPITGLTPRLQYRIPKLFSWQLKPGHEYYLWMDASMSLVRPDSLRWFMDQLGSYDIAVFKHPWRDSIQEEAEHIEEYLKKGDKYITPRYKNGLHKEQLWDIQLNKDYVDDHLYASTSFIYKDSEHVRDAMREWWLHQSRYFTCDQLAFTYAMRNLSVKVIKDNPFKNDYIKVVSKHK